MSWVLAAWRGQVPTSSAGARLIFEQLADRYGDEPFPPAPQIQEYVQSLLARWPESDDDSPWSDAPLLDDATGDLFVFGVGMSRIGDVLPFCTQTARDLDLVLFDTQDDAVYAPILPEPEVVYLPTTRRRRLFRRP